MIDKLMTLLILTVTLTSVYGLLVKSFQFESSINTKVKTVITRSSIYDENIKKFLQE